jgi:phosphatidylglycerophosphatase B
MISNRGEDKATIRKIYLRSGLPLLVTWLLIPLAFLLPLVDSTREPYFDLTNTFSQGAYWLTQTGGKFGTPIIALLMLTLLVTRGGLTFQRRWKESSVVLVVAAVLGGGVAMFNEYVLKDQLEIPRPNIIALAGENGSGPLGMAPKDFYKSGDREARGVLLADTLNRTPRPIAFSSSIERHWIDATGYSFPSGHSFSAMFFAAFFLMTAATFLTTKRLIVFYALLPWALAVCYSRSILRVHTPTDIVVGGAMGLAVGAAAWAVARALIRKLT